MPVQAIAGWIKQHGLTVVVALLMFVGSNLVTHKLTRVDKNTADIATVCTKVNAAIHYLDSLVDRTTRNADQPRVTVADPAVQALIDQARTQNEDFKAFAAEQSKKAECRVR